MIRFIGLAFLFTVNSAYACPTKLLGTFSCTTDDLTEEVTIGILGDQKQPIYVINGSYLRVDDIDHPIVSEDPGFRNAVAHVSCTDTHVARHLSADFYDNQEKVGTIDSTIEYSLEDDNLVQTTRGKMSNAQGDIPLDERVPCTRE
jgi:hypothetical protein